MCGSVAPLVPEPRQREVAEHSRTVEEPVGKSAKNRMQILFHKDSSQENSTTLVWRLNNILWLHIAKCVILIII